MAKANFRSEQGDKNDKMILSAFNYKVKTQ